MQADEVAGGGAGLFGVIPSWDSMGVHFEQASFCQRSPQATKLDGPKKVFYVHVDQTHKEDSRVKFNQGINSE